MRRWFRKKDLKPKDQEQEALTPQEEEQETPSQVLEEVPPVPEGQAPELDTSPSPVSEPEEGHPEGPVPDVETPAAPPRRGFFRRRLGQEEPQGESLEIEKPAAEDALPAPEAPAPPSEPSQPPEPQPVPQNTSAVAAPATDEFVIDLVEELKEEEEGGETRKRRFRRFRERLGRTRKNLAGGLERLFLGRREVNAELLDDLEEMLITADLGVDTTLRLMEAIRDKVKRRELRDADRLKDALRDEMVQILKGPLAPLRLTKPWVILMVGVNGVGKTTTIAKLAHRDHSRGLNPLLIAADTFRAAAVEQLEIWGERSGAQVVKQKTGADPAAVVFDGLEAAQARGVDVVYVDTAGRLHTKVNLMEELKKIHRTAAKKMPGAPHEILLILDATTGQNALSQARLFHEAVGVTGLILTKLDGTAKGGMALAVAHETGLPIRYIGVGEGMDDLQPFDPEAFVAAILD
jgi:fused signal recognition particle receptor